MHRPAVAMELQVLKADAPTMSGKPIRNVASVIPHTACTTSVRPQFARMDLCVVIEWA